MALAPGGNAKDGSPEALLAPPMWHVPAHLARLKMYVGRRPGAPARSPLPSDPVYMQYGFGHLAYAWLAVGADPYLLLLAGRGSRGGPSGQGLIQLVDSILSIMHKQQKTEKQEDGHRSQFTPKGPETRIHTKRYTLHTDKQST